MDLDTDSDDDILPNMNSLNSMFASVSQQVRREAPPPQPKSKLSNGDSSKGSSSRNDRESGGSKSKRRKPLLGKSSSKRVALDKDPDQNCNGLSNGKGEVSPGELSDDTSMLLAAAESLGVPKRDMMKPSTSTSASSTMTNGDSKAKEEDDDEIEEVEVTDPAPRTRSGKARTRSTRSTRSKKRGKEAKGSSKKKEPAKVPVPFVELDDEVEVDDDEVATQELMMDELELNNCSQISDTIEVAPIVEAWSLRIRWREEVLRFSVPIRSKISQLRMDVGKRLSIRADDLIVFNEREQEAVPDDTPVEQIPYGSTLSVFRRLAETTDAKKLGPNYIQLKVQGGASYRERVTVAIQRTTHIKQLLDDYVEKFGLKGKTYKLIFDGDEVDLTETAETLDLDGGEMFDIVEVA